MSWRICSGFTLLELMLVIALGSILIIGLMLVFAQVEHEVYRQKKIIDLLNQIQFITDDLTNDLLIANDPACPNVRIDMNHDFLIYQCVFHNSQWQQLPVKYFLRNKKLYRKFWGERSQELARGIINMQISPQMERDKIIGIQFWFLLQSDMKLWQQKKYYFDGQTYLINANCNYIAWPIVIAFRERQDNYSFSNKSCSTTHFPTPHFSSIERQRAQKSTYSSIKYISQAPL